MKMENVSFFILNPLYIVTNILKLFTAKFTHLQAYSKKNDIEMENTVNPK